MASYVKGDRIMVKGSPATVKYMQGSQVRFQWDGTTYAASWGADGVTPLALCDHCPNTEFAGSVCPTCGYDYSAVTD